MEHQENETYEPIDLRKLLNGYEDKWVVISKDYKNIIKYSDKFEELKEYINQGIIMLVPNPQYSISPYYLI